MHQGGTGPLQLLLGLIALWTSTLVIIAIDKKIRSSNTDFAPLMTEPGWGSLIALTILCNIAALPFYFGRARGGVWVLLGFALFGVCFGCMIVGNIIGVILDVMFHLR